MNDTILIIDGRSLGQMLYYQYPIIQEKLDTHYLVDRWKIVLSQLQKQNKWGKCLVLFEKEQEIREKYTGRANEYFEQMRHVELFLQQNNVCIFLYKVDEKYAFIQKLCEQKKKEEQLTILSTDEYVATFVSDSVSWLQPQLTKVEGRESFINFDIGKVEEYFGVDVSKLNDYMVLTKEKSILGESLAKYLLNEYDNLDCILADKEKFAVLNNQVDLEKRIEERRNFYSKRNVNFEIDFDQANWNEIDFETDLAENEVQVIEKEIGKLSGEIIEKQFTAIETNIEWKKLKQEIESQTSDTLIGLHIGVDEEVFSTIFMQENNTEYTEKNGQLSLFALEPEKQKNVWNTCSISMEQGTYLIELGQGKIDECDIVTSVFHWIKCEKNISVINGKNFLYALYLAFVQYNLDCSILDYEHMKNIFDCSIARYLLDPLLEKYEYQELVKKYVDTNVVSLKEYLQKESWSKRFADNREEGIKVACYPAFISRYAKEELINELQRTNMGQLYFNVELPLLYVLFAMEKRGILLNSHELKDYGERLAIRIGELEKKIIDQAGEEFNINSPKQLGVVLFEHLELPNGKKTKTGYSTSAEILEPLQKDYPIVKDILEYRQLTKLKSTYAEGLVQYISQLDGRIHTKLHQTITATGRLSSTEPNLQNIPIRMELGREIRKVFVPKDGYVFLDADYSQIELRLLAHMSQDPGLLQDYKEGRDIHRATASRVFHTPYEEVTSIQRSNAKAVNFGIVYGISAFGLSQDLNISRKEADSYIKEYFSMYPKIKEYLDKSVENGKKDGYVLSLLGRRRDIPELSSSNHMQRAFGERIAMNSPIQGTAADIIKIAMIRVEQRLKKEKLQSQLLLQIHDELLVETHPDEISIVEKIIKEEMSQAVSLSLPLEVDVKMGKNWNEAH